MADPAPRRSRAELRALLLAAGVEIVNTEGVGVGGSAITYKGVFGHLLETKGIRVTGASVHERIWDSVEAFRLDVLRAAITYDGPTSLAGALHTVGDVLKSADLSSEQGRVGTLRTMIRLATRTDANVEAQAELERWLAVVATFLGPQPNRDEDTFAEISKAVTTKYVSGSNLFVVEAGAMFKVMGLQPRVAVFGLRSDSTFDQAVQLFFDGTMALVEGLGVRLAFDQSPRNIMNLPTGQNGEDEEWNLFGLSTWSLATSLFEAVPDWSG